MNVEQNVYTVFDSVSVFYLPPFFAANNAEAIRTWQMQRLFNPQDVQHVHAGDYSLWLVGTFNMNTGEVAAASNRIKVAEAVNYLESPRDSK